MAEYILPVQFLGPADSGSTITMSWTGAGGTIATATEEFLPTRTGFFKTAIDSDPIQQATNFYDALTLDFDANFNISRTNNIVFISSENTLNPMSGSTTSSNIVFSDEPSPSYIIGLVDSAKNIRARSPYLQVSTGDTFSAFTTTEFTIRQYEGNILSASTAPVSYVKTKQKITPLQNNVWVNISNLVKEDLKTDISYYLEEDYLSSRNLSLNESKWVYIESQNYLLGTATTLSEDYFFVVDGYIEPLETQSLPNRVIMTGNKRYLNRNSNARIYFKTRKLGDVTRSTSSEFSSFTYFGDSYSNYTFVNSIKVEMPVNDDSVTYTFQYGMSLASVTIYVYDDCKYENYDLVFKNKYGFPETISMSKKTTKNLNVESSDYLRSIVDVDGNFNVNDHTNKQFNVTGVEEWTLNTDFLPEYMNDVVKEAMLSEEMWLIDSSNNIIPVIRTSQDITFKTSLNDKLIQYTLKVKLSHKTIKNIL